MKKKILVFFIKLGEGSQIDAWKVEARFSAARGNDSLEAKAFFWMEVTV